MRLIVGAVSLTVEEGGGNIMASLAGQLAISCQAFDIHGAQPQLHTPAPTPPLLRLKPHVKCVRNVSVTWPIGGQLLHSVSLHLLFAGISHRVRPTQRLRHASSGASEQDCHPKGDRAYVVQHPSRG